MSQYLPQPNKCYGNGVALDPEIGCEATSGWPAIPEWHKPPCQGAKCSEDGGENQCQDDPNFMRSLKDNFLFFLSGFNPKSTGNHNSWSNKLLKQKRLKK